MAMSSWSTSANNNILANTGILMDENQSPSSLNDSIREIMAVLKTALNSGTLDLSGNGTITKASGNTISWVLVQTGVATWRMTNTATTGLLTISEQGVEDWIKITKTTGAIGIPGHKAGTTTRVAGDCYLLVDASGNVHVSATGPAS